MELYLASSRRRDNPPGSRLGHNLLHHPSLKEYGAHVHPSRHCCLSVASLSARRGPCWPGRINRGSRGPFRAVPSGRVYSRGRRHERHGRRGEPTGTAEPAAFHLGAAIQCRFAKNVGFAGGRQCFLTGDTSPKRTTTRISTALQGWLCLPADATSVAISSLFPSSKWESRRPGTPTLRTSRPDSRTRERLLTRPMCASKPTGRCAHSMAPPIGSFSGPVSATRFARVS